ncbi:MAG: PAS domain S-box protein [Syntrophorhabdales bacterium]|jgi:PAS domain S-box-containing protein
MNLAAVLQKSRGAIIREWSAILLTGSGKRYGDRPLEELITLTSEATDANYAVLIDDNFAKIDSFIEKITRMRLSSGFTLSEVQKAFNVYRTIVMPALARALNGDELIGALKRLDYCLLYTITRFSDYFQTLHEKQVTDHAQNLEKEVMKRTGELSESEAKYRMLVEEINDGFFINQNGNIIFANHAYCEMHGYSTSEVLGKSFLDFVAPQSIAIVQSFYEKRMADRIALEQYMYYRRHKNGSLLPTENKVKLILYQGEYAAAGICRDITERVKMEQQLRESESLAHIGQLTTSLAHEIRNPLSSIKMSIQMLLKTRKLSGGDRRTMEISAREIARLERVLAEMLDFARPVRLKLKAASIDEIIESCVEIVEPRIKEKNLIVGMRLGLGVPKALLDREKLEQAVINVLLNAIEALPEGGKIDIFTRCRKKEEPAIRVEISDDGPGVGAEDLPYIFDPFYSGKKKGTGLGLSNVKKIVEAHGGTVSATPRRRGLVLAFTLPIKAEA